MFIGVTNYAGRICFVITGKTREEVKTSLEATSDYEDFPLNIKEPIDDAISEILIYETRQADEVIVDDPDDPLIEPKGHCKLVEKLKVNEEGEPYWAPVFFLKEKDLNFNVDDFTVEIP
jgi:hypothetical protein